MTESIRLDTLLCRRGIFSSRQRAQRAIAAGQVYAGGKQMSKPGVKVPADCELAVSGVIDTHVGRGYYKLDAAFDAFGVNIAGADAADIGASTGGFTECMLERGASRVLAVDVGHGQLDPGLLADTRVISMENTDIRSLDPVSLPFIPKFAACDLSFISLRLILPSVYRLLDRDAEAICLIKPQFEAGRGHTGKGVVRDSRVHDRILAEFEAYCADSGFARLGVIPSPITGGDGNAEFLAHLKKQAVPANGGSP